MPHTMQIPDNIWNWAVRAGGTVGPASFLRDALIGAMEQHLRNGNNSQPQPQQTRPQQTSSRGKGVHMKCFNEMVDELDDPDSVPSATPYTAERQTQCPKCKKFINPGDEIVITNMNDWHGL